MRENKLQPKGSAAKASTAARVATSALFVAGLAGLTSSAGTGCGRSSLEDAILDGGATVDARVDAPPPDAAACGPSTCPTGCCDASGVCRVGTDVQACGNLGGKCTNCVGSGFDTCDATRKACGKKVATCDATSCGSGCCVTTGGTQVCLPGTDALACGTGAGACVDCGSKGQACDPKLRVCGGTKCDATNCAGCCVGDKCQIGTDGTACGAKGQACENCTAQGTTCGALPGGGGLCEGIGRCGPMNCGGCCDARGTCTEGIDSTSCGRGGEACNDCTPRGQVCAPRDQPDGRTCVTPPACGPANCAGCCIGDVCTAGNQDTACGAAGGQCLNCVGTNQTCGAGGVCTGAPTCGPANCAGCCDGNTCVPGTAPATCGAGGQACRDCGAGTCNPGGTCSSPACSGRQLPRLLPGRSLPRGLHEPGPAGPRAPPAATAPRPAPPATRSPCRACAAGPPRALRRTPRAPPASRSPCCRRTPTRARRRRSPTRRRRAPAGTTRPRASRTSRSSRPPSPAAARAWRPSRRPSSTRTSRRWARGSRRASRPS